MPFNNVEECFIQPHNRFASKKDYPQAVVVCHHKSYLEIAREVANDNPHLQVEELWDDARDFRIKLIYKGVPVVLDNSRDNAEETASHVIEHSFWGGRKIINISSAGAVNPELNIGDYVIGDRAVRDSRSTWNLATPDVEALSDPELTNQVVYAASKQKSLNTLVSRGDVWSAGNMYYSRKRLEEIKNEGFDPHCVETEMEALTIVAGWLNHNYGNSEYFNGGHVSIANIFYISDVLPSPGEQWVDTMNNMQLLIPFKQQVLLWALDTLTS